MQELDIQRYLRSREPSPGLASLGVTLKTHPLFPQLLHLKYGRDAKFDQKIVRECRGIIVDTADDYRVVCNPYRKFFNIGDPLAAEIDWSTAVAWEKLDGSLISLYYYQGAWQTATTGTPDAGGSVGDSNVTFAELFWNTVSNLLLYVKITSLPLEYTYMFELVSPMNRVVVRYDTPGIYLIGARNNLTGIEASHIQLDALGLPMPWGAPASSAEQIVKIAQTLDPLTQEGFVVCDAAFNRIKVKSRAYWDLHSYKTSMSPRAMANMVRKQEHEGFIDDFPEYADAFLDMQRRHETICLFLRQLWERYGCITDRKNFALAIKDYRGNACLFSMRDRHVASVEEWLRAIPDGSYLKLIGIKEKE